MCTIFVVSTPYVRIYHPNRLTIGQPVTLDCYVNAARGITISRVDIVWSINGTEVRRVEGVSSSGGSGLYTDQYNISMLSISDSNRVYQCRMIINAHPPVTADYNHTLHVTGKLYSFTG